MIVHKISAADMAQKGAKYCSNLAHTFQLHASAYVRDGSMPISVMGLQWNAWARHKESCGGLEKCHTHIHNLFVFDISQVSHSLVVT
jgi:hypothetical protein